MFLAQGKYQESLDLVNKFIEEEQKEDPALDIYSIILKAEILNNMQNFKEAYQILKNLNLKEDTSENLLALSFKQMAISELKFNKIQNANQHIETALEIFKKNEEFLPKENKSIDSNVASSYVVKADILQAQNLYQEALIYYDKALLIYQNLYQERAKNIMRVSDLYEKGATAACKLQDLENYKKFFDLQIKDFGINHLNTIRIQKTCKYFDV